MLPRREGALGRALSSYPFSRAPQAVAVAEQIGDEEVVIKSQILAGGRGLGTFTNGFQGGVHVIKTSEVAEYAGKMLGQTLVTKQSGPAGKPVDTLLIAKKMQLVNEMYFAIMLDRSTMGPLMIACAEGGTSIEDLAEKYPEKIIKVPVNIREGITDAQAAQVVEGLEVSGDKAAAAGQIKALYTLFAESDCTMVEVRREATLSRSRHMPLRLRATRLSRRWHALPLPSSPRAPLTPGQMNGLAASAGQPAG